MARQRSNCRIQKFACGWYFRFCDNLQLQPLDTFMVILHMLELLLSYRVLKSRE